MMAGNDPCSHALTFGSKSGPFLMNGLEQRDRIAFGSKPPLARFLPIAHPAGRRAGSYHNRGPRLDP